MKGGEQMTDAERVKAARAAYAREYRRRNPDKAKAAQEKYWLRRAERERAKKSEESISNERSIPTDQ